MFSMPPSLKKEVYYGFHHRAYHNDCVSVGYRIQLGTTERREEAACAQAGWRRSLTDVRRCW
jgi:hypothetical protein